MIQNTNSRWIGYVLDANNPSMPPIEYASAESQGEKGGNYIIREIRRLQNAKQRGEVIDRHQFERYQPYVDGGTKNFEIRVFQRWGVFYK